MHGNYSQEMRNYQKTSTLRKHLLLEQESRLSGQHMTNLKKWRINLKRMNNDLLMNFFLETRIKNNLELLIPLWAC
jgi:hypothetical protein